MSIAAKRFAFLVFCWRRSSGWAILGRASSSRTIQLCDTKSTADLGLTLLLLVLNTNGVEDCNYRRLIKYFFVADAD